MLVVYVCGFVLRCCGILVVLFVFFLGLGVGSNCFVSLVAVVFACWFG